MQCRICFKSVGRPDNMKRHMRTVHDKRETDEDISEQESDSDNPIDSDNSIDSDNPADAENEDPWDDLITEAFEECDSKYRENVKAYRKRTNLSEEEVRQRVYGNMRDTYRKTLANALNEKVLWFNDLRRDPIYKTIKRTVSDLQSEHDYDEEEAWKYGISKRKYALDKILKQYEPPDLPDASEVEQSKALGVEQSEQTGGGSISRVSPVQQTVDIAKSMLERPLKKRKLDYPSSEDVYVIGKK